MNKRRMAALAVALLAAGSSVDLDAFVRRDYRWPSGAITMHLQLLGGGPLADGSRDWNDSAAQALAVWNELIGDAQFSAVGASTAPLGSGNTINNVFFDDSIYDDPFNAGTLAITLTTYNPPSGTTVETDGIFNTAYQWNSYSGTLAANGVIDFRRVAIHEFGHVLGLGHPDGDGGQMVTAIMNAAVSNIFLPQADDQEGAWALYGRRGALASVSFPPRDQTLTFRQALEGIYRDTLGRSRGPSYVDMEGSVIWISEDVRFLLSGCNGDGAANRVFRQIAGFGPSAPCGPLPIMGQPINFPPRDLTFAFRRDLEEVYRDALGRSPVMTYVDPEGDVVWTQEFLRFVMQGCTPAEATDRVLTEIVSGAVLSGCR